MPRGDIIAKQLWGDIFAELPQEELIGLKKFIFLRQ